MVAAPAIGGGISSRMVGLGLVLAADKASLDASLGILTATSALLATKWASNSLVVVAKEGATSSSAAADVTAWEAHPLIKHQRVQPKSIWTVFSPRNLVVTAVKSWFEQVRSEEALADLENRDIEWPPFPKHRLRPTMITAAYQFVKDLTVTAVRLLMQNLVWRNAPVWVANKTLKDFRRSAVRKYHTTSWYARPWKLASTAVRANAIAYAAECSVSIAFDSVRYIRGETTTNRRLVLRRLGLIAYTNIFRCTTSLLVASAAAGVGSLLAGPYPGAGASVCFLVADTASQLVLVPYLLTRQ